MTGVDLDSIISTYLVGVLGEVGTRQMEESVKLPVFGDLDLAIGECHYS